MQTEIYYVNGTSKRKHGMPCQKFISGDTINLCHLFKLDASKNICYSLSKTYITHLKNGIYSHLYNDGTIE